jgi:hypothetical protein
MIFRATEGRVPRAPPYRKKGTRATGLAAPASRHFVYPTTAAARKCTLRSQGRRESLRGPNAIDFWRGFALLTIFINHIPGNAFERFT